MNEYSERQRQQKLKLLRAALEDEALADQRKQSAVTYVRYGTMTPAQLQKRQYTRFVGNLLDGIKEYGGLTETEKTELGNIVDEYGVHSFDDAVLLRHGIIPQRQIVLI